METIHATIAHQSDWFCATIAFLRIVAIPSSDRSSPPVGTATGGIWEERAVQYVSDVFAARIHVVTAPVAEGMYKDFDCGRCCYLKYR